MLPTLMPAIASWMASVVVIAVPSCARERGRHVGVAAAAALRSRRLDGEAARRWGGRCAAAPAPPRAGVCDPSREWREARARLVVALEDVALAGARPLHRLPLPVLDHHRDEREVADVMLGRDRARRGDRADAIVLQPLQR